MKKVPAPLLTPSEACLLAGVGATTLKRWADQGLLAHVKTPGGHRRFLRVGLEQFLARQVQGGRMDSLQGASSWLAKLLGGPAHEVEAQLLLARSRLGSWHAVADELGVVLTEMGLRFERGELSILEEHIASERLSRALGRIGEALPGRLGAPCALLACSETDEHELGLALVELCLRELGWRSLWAGRSTPVTELENLTASMQIDLLALSASAGSSDGAALAESVGRLERSCRRRGIALALGGRGAWPEKLDHARRFTDFASFHQFVAGLAPPAR